MSGDISNELPTVSLTESEWDDEFGAGDYAATFGRFTHDEECGCYDCICFRNRFAQLVRQQQLEDILARFIDTEFRPRNGEYYSAPSWPGCDFAKAIIGNAIVEALARTKEGY